MTLGISGDMRTGSTLLADVNISVKAKFGDKNATVAEYGAVAGGFGNGAPENGNYEVSNYRNRGPSSKSYHAGMTRDGVGFSYDLNPQFSTGRTDLRIHPDGRSEGTEGCIGVSGNSITLSGLKDLINSILKDQNSINTYININDNPNNDGRKTKHKSVGE